MALKWALALVSSTLVLSRLDRSTDCCVTILSGKEFIPEDSSPYVVVEGGYEPNDFTRWELARTQTLYTQYPKWNEEFCGINGNELDNMYYDYLIFKVYNAQGNKLIGTTNKQYIEDEECCDDTQRGLPLDSSDGITKNGKIKVLIKCDYNCGTTFIGNSNTLPPMDDVKPCEYIPSGQSDPNKKDLRDRSEVEVKATATFRTSESYVYGSVKVDSNGNVFVNLDLSNLDVDCSELEYAIYERSEYDDARSQRDCDLNKLGDLFDPFGSGVCDQYEGYGDMYFECATGDLSERCGTIAVDNDRADFECNVSEENSDKEGGFCKARLTPESLYKRSIAFNCKNNRDSGTKTFCAGFKVTNDFKV